MNENLRERKTTAEFWQKANDRFVEKKNKYGRENQSQAEKKKNVQNNFTIHDPQ